MKRMIAELKYILSTREKQRMIVLFFMMLLGGFLELLGVSVVLPLVQAILQEEENGISLLGIVIQTPGMTRQAVVVALAVAMIGLYVLKNLFLLWMYHEIFSFVYGGINRLSVKMLSVYMNEPYGKHLYRNVSQIQRTIRSDVSGCYYVIKFLLQMMSEIIICFTLFCYLLLTDFKITLFLMILIGSCCGLFFVFSRRKVKELGTISQSSQTLMNQWILQAMGGIKEVRLLGRESYFVNMYEAQNADFSRVNRKQQLILQMPRMLTETVCISGVMILLMISAVRGERMEGMLPIFAVFAVAAFRMLPSVGKINTFLTELIYYRPTVESVYHDLKDLEKEPEYQKTECVSSVSFAEKLELQNISFSYLNCDEPVLEGVSLTIKRGSAVALVGPSGVGKTTLADIIMGLLEPKSGKICVDGKDIRNDLSGWYRQIGYVPQSIYLSDDTIRNNVAFGLKEQDIRDEMLWKALDMAQLSDFVKRLPQGENTKVGDRGVRLSGGQRQRIGIARALYHNPELLVLDEATSALDTETEQAVMDAINHLHGQKTMIIIAHRLSTIEKCDDVYEIFEKRVRKKEKTD